MTVRDCAIPDDRDDAQVFISLHGDRYFVASTAVVDGIASSRLDSVSAVRLMFEVFDDGARTCPFHYRANFTVDEPRYLRTGYIHRVGCNCYFSEDPCREYHHA